MPKTINGLMKYLRDAKGIEIAGTTQKRQLRNMGYYHGYKGYRFIGRASNQIPYSDFKQLMAVYEFDMQLKALFYPHLMTIETSLKNIVLEEIINAGNSDSFNYIYTNLLTDYKRFPAGSDKQKKAIKQRLALRNRVYSALTRNYESGKDVVQHFYHKGANVPIWAIFEILTLGEFGAFFGCLNEPLRKSVSVELGVYEPADTNTVLAQKIIFALKELRNAVAHNDVTFDTRFSRASINGAVMQALSIATGIADINFKSIFDYVILLVFLQKNMGTPKRELHQFISGIRAAQEKLRQELPYPLYSKIIATDTRKKLNELDNFVSR